MPKSMKNRMREGKIILKTNRSEKAEKEEKLILEPFLDVDPVDGPLEGDFGLVVFLDGLGVDEKLLGSHFFGDGALDVDLVIRLDGIDDELDLVLFAQAIEDATGDGEVADAAVVVHHKGRDLDVRDHVPVMGIDGDLPEMGVDGKGLHLKGGVFP